MTQNKNLQKIVIEFGCLGHAGIFQDGKLYIDAQAAEDIMLKLINIIEGGEHNEN